MTNQEYHSDTTRISKSGLDMIARSPAHYKAFYLDGQQREETDAMGTGTAGHALILEPHLFKQNYFLFDDSEKCAEIGGSSPRATSKYKQWKAEILAENEGKTAINPKEYEFFSRLQDAISKHYIASALLAHGKAEQTVFFDEVATGAPCKLRMDWHNHILESVVDLKLVVDSSPEAFGKASFNHRYFVQAPFYVDGVNASDTDLAAKHFLFIAVEKTAPFNVVVYEAGPDIMQLGRDAYMSDLEVYMECKRTGIWPGYSEKVVPLRLPNYAFKRVY